jgi:hypothetical protein
MHSCYSAFQKSFKLGCRYSALANCFTGFTDKGHLKLGVVLALICPAPQTLWFSTG